MVTSMHCFSNRYSITIYYRILFVNFSHFAQESWWARAFLDRIAECKH